SQFAVTFETPEGSSLAYTEEKARAIEAAILDIDGVDYVYTTVGSGLAGTVRSGQAYVKLIPAAERSISQQELMIVARERLRPLFGVRTQVLEDGGLGGAVAPLAVEITGQDVEQLRGLA